MSPHPPDPCPRLTGPTSTARASCPAEPPRGNPRRSHSPPPPPQAGQVCCVTCLQVGTLWAALRCGGPGSCPPCGGRRQGKAWHRQGRAWRRQGWAWRRQGWAWRRQGRAWRRQEWACGRALRRVAAQTFLDGAGQRFCSSPNTAALCGRGGQRRQAAASAAPTLPRHGAEGEFLLLCLLQARAAAGARHRRSSQGRPRQKPWRTAAEVPSAPRHGRHQLGLTVLGTNLPATGSDPGGPKLFMTET